MSCIATICNCKINKTTNTLIEKNYYIKQLKSSSKRSYKHSNFNMFFVFFKQFSSRVSSKKKIKKKKQKIDNKD